MPELPEVETIVRGLQKPLIGRTFTSVVVKWEKSIQTPLEELRTDLPSQQIEAITRRGKYLQFHLSNGKTLILHLKMSGNLQVLPKDMPCSTHVHTIFGIDHQFELRFRDARKFGRVYLVDDPAVVTGNLGPEPLAEDFTVEDFKALFQKRKGRLKPLLLNQEFIAGIGNIYGDEGCFAAGLRPDRAANTLSAVELERLYWAIRNVLQNGIMYKGASFDDVYQGGEFQYQFQVYGRKDDPCYQCETPIQRVKLGGRSTHFCPHCQK